MIQKILQDVRDMKKDITELKRRAKYWPQITYMNRASADVIYATAFVRIKHDDIWYKVHVVESASVPIGSHNVELMIERLVFIAHFVQHHYKLCGMESLDELQMEEADRLKRDYPAQF